MSNYPPGVSGNEPQIAGYRTETEEVSCPQEDVPLLGTVEVFQILADKASLMTVRDYKAAVEAALEDLEEITGPCEWSGEVEIEYDGYMGYWDCPRCGRSNEVEVETEPDPDDARDLARDLALDD